MTANGRIRIDRLRATDSFYGARRAERPSDVRGDRIVCPFCPGNESLTGALLTPDPGPAWESRVIQNIYPAVVAPDGRHEVIVELRAHSARWPALDRASIERVLWTYRTREAIGYADGYAFVGIFKNAGPGSGASLLHPHAQVLALRAIPAAVSGRIERLRPECTTCESLGESGHTRLIACHGAVAAFVPDPSRTAFEVRIAPRLHAARFCESPGELLADLADAVGDMLRRLAVVLGEDFPFNMIVQSAPRDPRAESLMHWEIELIPRSESFGGFEVGIGGFLVSRAPEDAAAVLRAAGTAGHA